MSENYPMANTQVDPFYMKALESFKEAVDVKSLKEKEDDDVDFLSSTDMKIALCDFLKTNKDYLNKLKGLEDFLSEVLLQLITKRKQVEANPNEKPEESDFFEMFYDILYKGLSEEKLTFLNAYLESKSLVENYSIVDNNEDPFKQLFGVNYDPKVLSGMSQQQKDELASKAAKMDQKQREDLYKELGALWKRFSNSELPRVTAISALGNFNPVAGFLANLLTGGYVRINK